VTELYDAHALGMIRLAYSMLGDRPSAEDVVQEAFCGLYRRWPYLSMRSSHGLRGNSTCLALTDVTRYLRIRTPAPEMETSGEHK
jgi:hypothetical protein